MKRRSQGPEKKKPKKKTKVEQETEPQLPKSPEAEPQKNLEYSPEDHVLPTEVYENLWKIYNSNGTELDRTWIQETKKIREDLYIFSFTFPPGCGVCSHLCHTFATIQEPTKPLASYRLTVPINPVDAPPEELISDPNGHKFIGYAQRIGLKWVTTPVILPDSHVLNSIIDRFIFITVVEDRSLGKSKIHSCVKDSAKIVHSSRIGSEYYAPPVRSTKNQPQINQAAIEKLREYVSISHVLFFQLGSSHCPQNGYYFAFESALGPDFLVWVVLYDTSSSGYGSVTAYPQDRGWNLPAQLRRFN